MAFPDKLNGWITWMTANREKVFRYGRVLQIVVGLILLLLGWVMGHRQFHLILNGARAQGKIVDYTTQRYRRTESAIGNTGHSPVVEFQAGARTLRFTNWLGSSRSPTLNQIVPILYDVSNPPVAMIDHPVMNWIPWAPISALGCFLPLVAIVGLLKPSSRKR